MDKLTKVLDNRELVLGVFRNFSKAFDTVNHAILLQKLNHYGIRGCSLKWLESYISNRTQYVSYNDATLKLATIKCGVPQGSILGPLLFLISQPSIQIEIDNQKIMYTTKTKLLGVVIDHKLNWKDHISYISDKIARGLGIIIKARKCFTKTAMLSLYHYFIYPYLIYCNRVWGCACTTHVKPLVTLQKKAIRIISGVKPKTHTDPLFKQMNLLKCEDIHKYLIGKLMYKVYNGELIMFQALFKKNSDFHSYHTRQMDHYHIPSVRTKLAKSSFYYNGVVIWNNIYIIGIVDEVSEFVFSRTLKKRIMQGQV